MNIVSLNGQVFDVDEVVAKDRRSESILLTFRNGDSIDLRWRDFYERAEIHRALQIEVADSR